jgi:inner membrane protein
VNAFEHMLIGAGAGALVAHVAGGNLGLMMLAGALAAPLPDIDTQWARRSRYPSHARSCGLLSHRGPTHSLVAVAVVLAAATALVPLGWPQHALLAEAFAAGYASHLLGDAISPMGQPYFWPLIWRRFRVLPQALCVHSGTRAFDLPIALGLLLVGLTLHV